MRLIDHIGQDLTGIAGLSRSTFTDDVLLLTRIYGSGRGAARALNVPESTFRGWRKGVVPKGGLKRLPIKRAARAAAVQAHSEEHWIAAFSGDADALLAIKGVFIKSSDSRVRTLYPGRHVPNGIIRQVLKLWVAGQDDDAENTLVNAIDNHYEPFAFDQVFWARFNDGREVR